MISDFYVPWNFYSAFNSLCLPVIFMSNMQKCLGGEYKTFDDEMKQACRLLENPKTKLPNPQWEKNSFIYKMNDMYY